MAPRRPSEEAMQMACQAVRIRKKGIRASARLHGVNEATLRSRLKGKRPFHLVERTVISAQEEQRLVEWMKECARRGFGRTPKQVKVAVQALLNQRGAVTLFKDNLPGRKWMSLFLKRHSDSITKSGAQQAAVTHDGLRVWFKAAFSEHTDIGDVFDYPSRIFSCDETGFPLIGGALSKGLAANSDKQAYKISNDTYTQITVLACANASGDVHSPLIIFPGQRFRYDPVEGFPEAHCGKSTNGCIDSDIFTEWLRTAFIPAVEHLPKPVVLFADVHTTDLTLTVSDLCRDHNILLYQLPGRASTTFTCLKQVMWEEVLKFKEEIGEEVGKRNFSAVFKKAWARGIDQDVVISGFRTAGLYPWNPDHVNMTLQTETKAQVLGETTHETVTANIITLPSTSPSPLPPLSPSVDPPSPATSPSPLPSLSSYIDPPPPALSSVDPTSTTHLPLLLPQPSSSSSEAVPPTPSTTSLYSLPAPSHVTSSTSETQIDNMPFGQALDRLLDLAAKAGVVKLIEYRTSHTLRTETADPEERLFCSLYSSLMSRHKVDKSTASTLTTDRITLKTDEYRKKIQQVEENERRRPEREKRVEEEKESKKRVEEEKDSRKRTDKEKERKKRVEEEKERKKRVEEEKERKKRVEEEKERKKRVEEEKERKRVEEEKERKKRVEEEKERKNIILIIEEEKERNIRVEEEKERNIRVEEEKGKRKREGEERRVEKETALKKARKSVKTRQIDEDAADDSLTSSRCVYITDFDVAMTTIVGFEPQ